MLDLVTLDPDESVRCVLNLASLGVDVVVEWDQAFVGHMYRKFPGLDERASISQGGG